MRKSKFWRNNVAHILLFVAIYTVGSVLINGPASITAASLLMAFTAAIFARLVTVIALKSKRLEWESLSNQIH